MNINVKRVGNVVVFNSGEQEVRVFCNPGSAVKYAGYDVIRIANPVYTPQYYNEIPSRTQTTRVMDSVKKQCVRRIRHKLISEEGVRFFILGEHGQVARTFFETVVFPVIERVKKEGVQIISELLTPVAQIPDVMVGVSLTQQNTTQQDITQHESSTFRVSRVSRSSRSSRSSRTMKTRTTSATKAAAAPVTAAERKEPPVEMKADDAYSLMHKAVNKLKEENEAVNSFIAEVVAKQVATGLEAARKAHEEEASRIKAQMADALVLLSENLRGGLSVHHSPEVTSHVPTVLN